MRGATSGPTNRALDVLELLSRQPANQLRYVDIVRALKLNQGTAHSILKTLTDRGWVSRDAVAKTYSLGPAIAVVAAKAIQARPLANAARGVARDLAAELGFGASVVERVGDELLLSDFFAVEKKEPSPRPGLKVPYAPPYGVSFAAFALFRGREAWLARSATQSRAVGKALQRAMELSRERGYDVDWTTPAVAQMTSLVGSMDKLHPALLTAMDQILLEYTAPALDEADADRSVTSITAPVLDANGHARLGIALHPMRHIPLRRIQACGRRLAEEAKRIAALAGRHS